MARDGGRLRTVTRGRVFLGLGEACRRCARVVIADDIVGDGVAGPEKSVDGTPELLLTLSSFVGFVFLKHAR